MKHENYQPDGKMQKHTARWILIIVSVAVIAAVALIFVLKNGHKDLPQQTGNTVSEEDEGGSKITTPVGDLTIPKELTESAQMEDTSKDGQYAVSFYGMVGTDKVLLFEISVGTDGEGYKLGSATGTDGNENNIWLNISEIERKSTWSDDGFARLNELQSYVNELIDQISQLDGFHGGG